MRALEGRRNSIGIAANPGPASLPGRKIGYVQIRWLHFAPPPANIRRPSGTKMHRLTCGETNGWRSPYRGSRHFPVHAIANWFRAVFDCVYGKARRISTASGSERDSRWVTLATARGTDPYTHL